MPAGNPARSSVFAPGEASALRISLPDRSYTASRPANGALTATIPDDGLERISNPLAGSGPSLPGSPSTWYPGIRVGSPRTTMPRCHDISLAVNPPDTIESHQFLNPSPRFP